MRKGGQKQKGNTYERAIAKIFTQTYYPDGDGEFRRVPLSGGWDKRMVPGDLVALRYVNTEGVGMVIDDSFPLSIECKTWKGENVKHFFSGLYSNETILFDWIRQATEDCEPSKKMPVVVFKLLRTENILLMESNVFYQMGNLFGNFPGKKWYKLIKYEPDDTQLIFCLLKDFLNWIDWDVFKLSSNTRSIKSVTSGEQE